MCVCVLGARRGHLIFWNWNLQMVVNSCLESNLDPLQEQVFLNNEPSPSGFQYDLVSCTGVLVRDAKSRQVKVFEITVH